VRSRHWIADPDFRRALDAWCREETAAVDGARKELLRRSPFRATDPAG